MDKLFLKNLIENNSFLQYKLDIAKNKFIKLEKELNEMQSIAEPSAGGVAPDPPLKDFPPEMIPYIPADNPLWKPPPGYKDPRIKPLPDRDIPTIREYNPYQGIGTPAQQITEYQRLLDQWLNEYQRLYGWQPWMREWMNPPGQPPSFWQGLWNEFEYWWYNEYMPGAGGEAFPGIYGYETWGQNGVPTPQQWLAQHPPPPPPWQFGKFGS